VEQRQTVDHDVRVGPFPHLCERVEVGGDRAGGQDGALGWAGGARRVDDQGGLLAGRAKADARVERDRRRRTADTEDGDPPQRLGHLRVDGEQQPIRTRVVEDVGELRGT
jgi:hypothetical protein